jgi:hypothetical protein
MPREPPVTTATRPSSDNITPCCSMRINDTREEARPASGEQVDC